jgi:rare lipoprotein A (peptidoglycan hydrolase)
VPDDTANLTGDADMDDNAARPNRTKRGRAAARRAAAAGACMLALTASVPTLAGATTTARSSWAPHIDRAIVPTRVEQMGPQLATWYGPGLFGNRTACGQTLTPRTFGIAHRTLPCGTLVNLTYRGRQINVRVIDRGPFSGATVDLTSRTKYYLRFTSGKVRMTKVKRFRAIPREPQRVVGTFASST